jgi:peptidoglycan hydrolase-like protein with peptidoglycan-binding domain
MAEQTLIQVPKTPTPAAKPPVFAHMPALSLQRQTCGTCEDERKKKGGALQRFPSSTARNATPNGVPGIVHEVLGSPGHSLDASTRARLEPRFQHDFSQVRVHADARANESAQAVNALAYTVGRHIVFNAGQYSPGTSQGEQLLAHELTHTLQQEHGSGALQTLAIGPADDPYEREAERTATRVANGLSAQPVGVTGAAFLQRKLNDGHDLTATRFAGNLVLEAVFDNERLLQNGSKGTAVRLIQESLIAQGYDLHVFKNDGIFGAETEAAVRAFQIDAGAVKLDGIVGPETMGLLDMRDPGTTTPTGPAAGPPAAVGPATPPATGVVFSEHPSETFAGYDNSTPPDWLVVPVQERRRVRAVIAPAAARPAFVSADPTVATVDVTPDGIVVTGVGHGVTNIQAQEGGVALATLRISVKNQVTHAVTFHYVCDSAVPPHCSNGAPAADDMRSRLNRVWERQANVMFTGGNSVNVVAPGDLGAAVDWTSPGGGEWNTVTALGTGADYNIFRVWRYMQDGTWPNDAANMGSNTLVGDNPCADGWGPAHETGHFLGLDHPDGFIMTPCGGRVDQRVSKAMADKVNP